MFYADFGAKCSTELNSPLAVSAPDPMAGLAEPKGFLISAYGYSHPH